MENLTLDNNSEIPLNVTICILNAWTHQNKKNVSRTPLPDALKGPRSAHYSPFHLFRVSHPAPLLPPLQWRLLALPNAKPPKVRSPLHPLLVIVVVPGILLDISDLKIPCYPP
jgi:hypothetical protein